MSEKKREEAEKEKFDQFYADVMDFSNEEEEEDYCDYTGDLCFGDKMFCEECLILTGGDEK